MSTCADNKQLVADFFKRFMEQGLDNAFELLGDDAIWIFPARSRLGRTLTRAQVIAEFQTMGAAFTGKGGYTLHQMTAEEDRVAVEAESNFEMTSGKIYNNLYHFLFTVRDGKIREIKEYADTLYVSEILSI